MPKEEELPAFVQQRLAVWERLRAAKAAAAVAATPIEITLPDGRAVAGEAGRTTPLDVANGISAGLARAVLVARVDGAQLWDLRRPLARSCRLELLKFDDAAAQHVFWHSSAHILGEALELLFEGQLCIGPPLDDGGFYYDMASPQPISPDDFARVQKLVQSIVKENQEFERLEISKAEALELFGDNKYKREIITQQIGDDEVTTAYRCGPLIDLCRGPHVPSTKKVEAFKVTKNSSAYWRGDAANDSLQRVYGISFPNKKQLREWEAFQEKAAKRNHRVIGTAQRLFFFDGQLSPGSAFWLPHGARIYGRLLAYMRAQYHKRGFEEVITPNIYNHDLWKISGHLQNYADGMFNFQTRENEDYALKPMNCPGHCIMFKHTSRSYRELPLRFADFGVLHRNELSGALGGLTRVRRFQQDDAHIFCRRDQVEAEVASCINFMEEVYGIFQFDFDLELSTRPEKYLGEVAVWDEAEASLRTVLDGYAQRSGKQWRLNEGDGAFYGPKIDIHIKDALKRSHQCATIQLDFQLPQRFGLQFKAQEGGEEPPVIIHRAIFGSVERFSAILMEHTGGRWPLWLSPRQVCIVPVAAACGDFAETVRQRLHDAGFYVDVSMSDKTMQKRIAEASKLHYNYICVVGDEEITSDSVNVRPRPKAGQKFVPQEKVSVADFLAKLAAERDQHKPPADQDWFEEPNNDADADAKK